LNKNIDIFLKKYILFVVLFIYLLSYLALPFSDHDPLMYVMIGRALVRHGVLPYGYVFDHKPGLIYAIYGTFDAVWPTRRGMFAAFALISGGICAGLVQGWVRSVWAVVGFWLVFGAPFGILGGNAEAAYLPLVLGALVLMAGAGRSVVRAGVAGAVAMAAVQTNYLAGPSLLLPFLYAVFHSGFSGGYGVRRFLAGAAGAIGTVLVLALPYWLTGQGVWSSYLAFQVGYLSHYGAGASERLAAVAMFGGYAAVFVPFAVWALRRGWCDRVTGLLGLWAASGVLACLVSGHPFEHYFLLVLVPLGVLFGRVWPVGRVGWWALSPAIVVAVVWVRHDVHHNWLLRRELARIDYGALHRAVGDVPVLSVEASHVPFYMAGLTSATRYIFPDHVRTVYGAGAEGFYLEALGKAPGFVLTPGEGCPVSLPVVCGRLRAGYRVVARNGDRYGFTLYQRIGG